MLPSLKLISLWITDTNRNQESQGQLTGEQMAAGVAPRTGKEEKAQRRLEQAGRGQQTHTPRTVPSCVLIHHDTLPKC